jgi:hypothetical protein
MAWSPEDAPETSADEPETSEDEPESLIEDVGTIPPSFRKGESED